MTVAPATRHGIAAGRSWPRFFIAESIVRTIIHMHLVGLGVFTKDDTSRPLPCAFSLFIFTGNTFQPGLDT